MSAPERATARLLEHTVSVQALVTPEAVTGSVNGTHTEVTSVVIMVVQTDGEPPRVTVRVFGWPLSSDGARVARITSPRQVFLTPDHGPVREAALVALSSALTIGGWTRADARGLPGWLS
jgi:hypothetical protein